MIRKQELLECSIRKATKEDIKAIFNIYREQKWEGEDNSINKIQTHFLANEKDNNHILLVAEYKGEIVGTVTANINKSYAFDCKDYMVFDYLVVAKKYQRCKIGTKLIEALINIAKNRNVESIWLCSSADKALAHEFYTNLGFDDPVKGFRMTF